MGRLLSGQDSAGRPNTEWPGFADPPSCPESRGTVSPRWRRRWGWRAGWRGWIMVVVVVLLVMMVMLFMMVVMVMTLQIV